MIIFRNKILIAYIILFTFYRIGLTSELFYLGIISLVIFSIIVNNYKIKMESFLLILTKYTTFAILISIFFLKVDILFYKQLLKEMVLILLPFIISNVFIMGRNNEQRNKILNLLFVSHLVIYVLEMYMKGQLFSMSFLQIDDISNSDYESESSLAFVFGLFFIYYITIDTEIKYKKIFIVLSIILVLLSGKRIVLIGSLISILFYYLYPKKLVKLIPALAVIANVLYVYFIYSFSNGDYDDIIYNLLGVNSNQISMGRQYVYESYFQKYPISITPYGLGNAVVFLQINSFKLHNLHSDIIKYSSEYGMFIFSAYYYLTYNVLKKDKLLLGILLYNNILMLSDNVSVYVFYLILMYLILIIVNKSNEP